MNIKRILVDMDPMSEQQPALTRAITLAKKFDASIELFLVVYNSSLMVEWFFDNEQLEKVKLAYIKTKQRWLDTFVSKVAEAKIPVSVDVRWHKPIYEGINKKVKESNADLVIKSTHRHPTINKIFFNPNDWQLLKSCPVPLLLAKQNCSDEYSHIMAAVDPTQSHGKPEGLDKVILDTTIDLSEALSATAHVTHCYEPIGTTMWRGVEANSPGLGLSFDEYGDYFEQLKIFQNEQFTNILSSYNFDEENKHLESGDAVSLLPELVDKNNIDLLIMGTTYRTGLLGSTAEKILDNIHCDILAVKPEDFETL